MEGLTRDYQGELLSVEMFETLAKAFDKGWINPEELREIRGDLKIELTERSTDPHEDLSQKIKSLEDTEIPHWRKEANKERERASGSEDNGVNEKRAETLEKVAEWFEIESDKFRMQLEQPLEHKCSKEVLNEVVENNDQVTLEKVKKWLKENALAISGVLIMLASFITSVCTITRSGFRVAKSATSKIAEAFKKVAAKLGPILGPVLSLVGNLVSLGAKGIGFLLENLWLLFLFLVYLAFKWARGKK